jgi:hypothetical protein
MLNLKTAFPAIFICLLSFSTACFQVREFNTNAKPIEHTLFDSLLKKHVDAEGWVNYKGFIQDSQRFKSYLSLLSKNHPNTKTWTRDEQLAYWINAYNAFTIELICRYYPLESIKDVKRGIPFVSDTWEIEFINIEGKKYSLNNIEHGIIRPKFNEPRIHFAVNCASKSCPQLRSEAYTAAKLEAQLTEQARVFLADKSRNIIENGRKAQVSKLFTWFSGDFKKSAPSIIRFINRYSTVQLDVDAELEYLSYDWSLNEKK